MPKVLRDGDDAREVPAVLAHARAGRHNLQEIAPTQLAQQPPNSSAISCAQAMWSLTDSRWHCREVQLRVDQLTSSRYCERESLLPTSSAAARSKCITAGEKPPKVSKRRSRTSTPLAMAAE